MRKLLASLLFLAALASPAVADNILITQGGGTTVATKDLAGVHIPKHNLVNQSGTEMGTTASPWIVSGSGTAGTAATGVLTVQGIASMTPILSTVTNAGTFAVQAAQSGTWTVQPGNTANTTAWLVTGTGGTFPATQSGTWTVQPGNTANTTPWLITGSGTAGTAATGVVTVQGIASMTALLVNPGTAANWGIGATGSAVPANAVLTGLSDGTNTRAWLNAANALNSTGAGIGTAQIVGQFDDSSPTSITENQFGNIRMSANRNVYTTIRDAAGNERGVNVTASNEMSVNCSNCSGTGASLADEGTFAAGSTAFAPSGGFFQTTATSNALTNGQGGWVQMTANRAFMVNIRNASGAELGLTAAPFIVSGSGTAGSAATGVVTVQGIASGTNLPVSAASGAFASGSIASGAIASGAIAAGAQVDLLTMRGTKAAGTAAVNSMLVGGVFNSTPITLTDGQQSALQFDSAGSTKVILTGTNNIATVTTVSTVTSLSQFAGNAISLGAGAVAAGTLRVTQGSDSPLMTVLGAQGDSACATDNGTCSIAALIKRTNQNLSGAIPAGTNLIGKVGFDQTTVGTTNAVSIAQIGATTVDSNSGTKSAGTIRVVIATDQPQLTNKLLVTPDANSAVNVAQINGVTVLMGNGATGTGSQRVTVANDNSAVSGFGVGATAAAPPANAVYGGANGSGATGGQLQGLKLCDTTAKYDASDNGNLRIITGTSGRKIYFCGILLATGGTATNLKLTGGTGTNCGTGTYDITPAYQLVANDRIGFMSPFWSGMVTTNNADDVCINASAANAHQAQVFYSVI